VKQEEKLKENPTRKRTVRPKPVTIKKRNGNLENLENNNFYNKLKESLL